jgi:superfamily II DNA or RNA helicase
VISVAFRDLNLNIGYNSENIDVVGKFFVPVLKDTKIYRRVSAYYSSNSLKLIAEGLSEMLNNDGTMKLLVSYVISEEDFNAIIAAKKQPDEILKSMKIDNEIELKKLMEDKNVAALGYLIATKRIEIKFVLCRAKGIFHLKFGIFTDHKNDRISFSGSINETYEGLTDNIEEFKVFRSWIPEERKYLEVDSEKFDNYWNEKIDRKDYVVVEMPEKFKAIITKAYEQNKNKFKRTVKELPPLWPHQEMAVNAWKGQNYSGIVEMATGTGKTNMAIFCINTIGELHINNLLIVIGCPTRVLVDQWKVKLEEVINKFEIKVISQEETKDDIYKYILKAQGKNQIIIGTYASISKSWFTEIIIAKYTGKILFIADEAHWLGAKSLSKALSERYTYRLGLTATPMRYFDISGTEKIMSYFGGTIYKYTIKDAIRDGWLTPYDYHMFFGYLTEGETKEYEKLTRKFARSYAIGKSMKQEDNSLSAVLFERARIIKKAFNKIITFRQILQRLNNDNKLSSLLVYVEDEEQLSEYLDIMDEFDMEYRKIDGDTKDEDRKLILDDLAADKVDCVIAMKVLDEGVDVPNAKRAIFVSSSGNTKQFIQRRGRILRKVLGKKIADIYDICMLVDLENQKETDEFTKIERAITSSEFKRLAIISVSAHNKPECYEQLERVGKKLNIDVFDIINEVRKYAG